MGESLLDIVFHNGQPEFATPGGSMLNTAVSLGRAGISVHLISDTGTDEAGIMITGFLEQNGVSTCYISRHPRHRTTLALAFLDAKGDATYNFYKDPPPVRWIMGLPRFQPGDILAFGSFYSINPVFHAETIALVRRAREEGALVFFDPNFRRPHLPELEAIRPLIMENLTLSDIVRGSDEDFSLIAGIPGADEAWQFIRERGPGLLFYTRNREGAEARSNGISLSVQASAIEPLSTIGAGDAFNAGLIFGLTGNLKGRSPESFTSEEVRALAGLATRFAANVCMQKENYISQTFAGELHNNS